MEFKPYNYQQHCIDKVIELKRIGLFLDMGLGKTVITLTAINILKYMRFEIRRTLIIAPLRVAQATWQNEVEKWEHLKHLKVISVLGTAKARIQALNTVGDVYVINRDNVKWLVEYMQLNRNIKFDCIVLDELSSFKNRQSQRTKYLAREIFKCDRVIGLTGTPTPNGLIDLWSQVFLLDGGERLERSIGKYKEKYFNPDKRNGFMIYSYKPKDGAMEAITKKIEDICISMKSEDYIELPDYVEQDIRINLNAGNKKLYDRLERDMILEVDEETDITALNAGALNIKLQQLANGAVYTETGEVIEVHEEKLDALEELIESLQSNAIVFYNFKHDKDRIMERLKKYNVVELKGAEEQNSWNEGKIQVLLAHPASSSYGLNLQQGGHHTIWFSPTWNYEHYAQANKRLHRQGQKHTVYAHRLIVNGTVDVDVIAALERKATGQDALLESLKARIERVRLTM